MRNPIAAALACIAILFLHGTACARTLILGGSMGTQIELSQSAGFAVQKPVAMLTYRFALPREFRTKVGVQEIKNLTVTYSIHPSKTEDETDAYGNRFRQVTWQNLTKDVEMRISFTAVMGVQLDAIESTALFPLKEVPSDVRVFLKPTKQVQAEHADIAGLARTLTAGVTSEIEAVNAILNFVTDTVKYTYNPPQYDALYTLNTKSGNCQNFAHLAIALLRAAGIPARIVGGISLKDSWKVPAGDNRTLVQSMGQGGHAWLEIFFSDLGWLAYDPQQTKQFTSTRHIKQTHGLDSNDINDSWKGAPYLPAYNENIDARLSGDDIRLTFAAAEERPRSYILSNRIVLPPKPAGAPEPKILPPPVVAEEKKPEPAKGKSAEFGNLTFPSLVDLYTVSGNTATRVFDKETAEYVTSRDIYAQAFTVTEPLRLTSVSLAMHKFGGDGAVYIDLLADDNGKPALQGRRSDLIFLNRIERKPGYYWVEFTFSDDNAVVPKGRYWIVLRRSGEAIMNWFYVPGNPYGDEDDTRSTAKGWQWEDTLNYDFVFRVRAERN